MLGDFVAAVRQIAPTALIAVDEEGGDVTRLHYWEGSPYPGNGVIGRLGQASLARQIGAQVGADLRTRGFNFDIAPSVDVNSNPNNPVIGVRSFGSEAQTVAEMSQSWISGLQGQGVAGCAKHFPGHGDTEVDSHLDLPTLSADLSTLRDRELLPFQAAIEADCAAIMTSHIMVPALDSQNPATFSHTILTTLLREEMGFRGVIITDALDMEGAADPGGIPGACVRALDAGADMLCLGPASGIELVESCVSAIVAAVARGDLAAQRVYDAAGRDRRLAERFRAVPPSSAALPGGLRPSDVATAFQIGDRFVDWLHDHPDFEVYQVPGGNSQAMGEVPWGPFGRRSEAGAGASLGGNDRFDSPRSVREGQTPRRPVLAVGRLIHLQPAAGVLQSWREAGVPVACVEMGWPPAESDPLRLDTFGASRLVGEALIEWLRREGISLQSGGV